MKNKIFTSLLAATLTMSTLPATAIYANETKDTIQLEKGKTEGILHFNVGDNMYLDFKFFYTPAPKPEVKPESKPAQKVENTENPKTGDTTNYMFLVSSFVVAGAAALKLRKRVMD